MKRIFIFSHAMELGGAERALLGLLEAIDPEQVQVDLFLMRHSGELMRFIPKYVHLLPERPQYASLAVPIRDVIREGQVAVGIGRFVGKIAAKHRVRQMGLSQDNGVELEYSHKYTRWAMPHIGDGEYDLAISFLTPHYFVAEKVKAKKKVAWIHTDYACVHVDVESETAMWGAYDYIASISDAVTDGFLKIFPALKDKLVLIENVLPTILIQRQAEEFSVDKEMPFKGICLLSVGRYCVAKNFDNVPAICKRIVEMGLNVKWYIIGYGGDEQLICEKIKEAGMDNYVIMLGKKENPYPYISACDLYVQPSRYEGNCVTVHEAQILGKPVVITRYATSKDQLEEGVDGVIVPMDNEGCAEGIAALLRDPQKMRFLSDNCLARDYSNSGELEKLLNLC